MSPWDHPAYKAVQEFFNEPDYYIGCAYGLPMYTQRNSMKAWCGYVGVPKMHPHWGKSYGETVAYPKWRDLRVEKQSPIALLIGASKMDQESNQINIDLLYNVHGGITYAEPYRPYAREDGNWWFGFDCSHYQDFSPGDAMRAMTDEYPWTYRGDGAYRNFKYVLCEARNLASQLSDFTSEFPEGL